MSGGGFSRIERFTSRSSTGDDVAYAGQKWSVLSIRTEVGPMPRTKVVLQRVNGDEIFRQHVLIVDGAVVPGDLEIGESD